MGNKDQEQLEKVANNLREHLLEAEDKFFENLPFVELMYCVPAKEDGQLIYDGDIELVTEEISRKAWKGDSDE